MSRRVAVPREALAEIARGRFAVVEFGEAVDIDGIEVASALVGRVPGGAMVAYANVCRHQSVPLDLGTGDAMTDDGRHLVCLRHGAVYATATGRCTSGPCEGATLFRLSVTEDAGQGDAFVVVELVAPGPR